MTYLQNNLVTAESLKWPCTAVDKVCYTDLDCAGRLEIYQSCFQLLIPPLNTFSKLDSSGKSQVDWSSFLGAAREQYSTCNAQANAKDVFKTDINMKYQDSLDCQL